MASKRSNWIRFFHKTIIIILLATGSFLIYWGISEHDGATYESISSPEGIVMLGDNDTVIEDMSFIVSESH